MCNKKGNRMLISIIIPAYNKEEKIVRCLESLRVIKALDIEFIIVNDGSTDNTKKICEKYLELDSRFVLITQENSGVSEARNVGVAHSKGKYISFVDADDEILPEYEKLLQILRVEDHELYGFNYCVQKKSTLLPCNNTLLRHGVNERTLLYNSFLTGQSNSVWMHVYRLSVIKKYDIKFTKGMVLGEDCEFNSLYFRHCSEIFYISEQCYKYYADDDGSATHQRKLNYLRDLDRMYQALWEIYQLEESLEFSFDYSFYMNFVYGIIKKNLKNITREQNKDFRQSRLFEALTTQTYENKKINLKRLYVKWNLYRVLRFV